MRILDTPAKANEPVGVLLAVVALMSVVFALIVWVLTSLEGLADIVRVMTRLCEGIFSQCLGYVAIGRMALLWTVGLTLLSGLIFAVYRAVATLIKSRRAINRLPLKNKKADLVLIEDSAVSTAFTHGIIHPRIYISRGLIQGLESPELRAVFHHELSHKKNRDPLRFFLLSMLKDILFFIPLAAHASRHIRDNQEKRADDMAVSYMREPFSIAGALIKLTDKISIAPIETVSILGRHIDLKERIHRLLGEDDFTKSKKGPGVGAVLVSLILPLFMLISLAMPLKQGLSSRMSCTMAHCSSQRPKPEKNCRIHCDKTTRIQRPAPLMPLP